MAGLSDGQQTKVAPTRGRKYTRGIVRVVIAATIGLFVFALGYRSAVDTAVQPRHLLIRLTTDASLAWERNVPSIATGFPVGDGQRVYLSPSEPQKLLALDAINGEPTWELDLLKDHTGVRQIVAGGTTVFALTSTSLTSHEPLTGGQQWSLRLGNGHVRVLAIDRLDTLVVLYGDAVVRVAMRTGEVLEREPMGELLWPSEPIQVNRDGDGMSGLDNRSGKVVWRVSLPPFVVAEHAAPEQAHPSMLIVFTDKGDLCGFDLSVGSYEWCKEGPFASNVADDGSSRRAFVLDDDFNLLSLDPLTGESRVVALFPIAHSRKGTHAYDYALSAAQGKLYVFFGDTNQLFAFDVTPSPPG